MPSSHAVAAIRAWSRLDEAFSRFNHDLVERFGVTGAQLAMLRIVAEWGGQSGEGASLAEIRAGLSLHPATVGQLLDRLATRGLLTLGADPRDRRRRRVTIAEPGRRLLAEAPVAGPVRLRHVELDDGRLRRLADAFDDAVDAFGLGQYGQSGVEK